MENKKVLVTGISGMDGSHMCDYLLENTDYEIYGMLRRQSNPNTQNYKHLLNNPRINIVSGDLTDFVSISKLIQDIKPDYFLNFACQSHVHESWICPVLTFESVSLGVLYCLEAIRLYAPNCRFYSAGSSEQFSEVEYEPQDEKHKQSAKSPYGAAKISSGQLVRVYRGSYNIYAVHGILFNHESNRRALSFLPRKVSNSVARINKCIKENKSFESLKIGSLDSKRDWSWSPDFMEGVWRMMNQEKYREDLLALNILRNVKTNQYWSDKIKDYVLASGEVHSVCELIEEAFKCINIEGYWSGEGINEKYYLPNHILEENPSLNPVLVEIDSKYYRPFDVTYLRGNASLAKKELNWQPKTTFKQLVKNMVSWDIENYVP